MHSVSESEIQGRATYTIADELSASMIIRITRVSVALKEISTAIKFGVQSRAHFVNWL